jgi:hypothetical protein
MNFLQDIKPYTEAMLPGVRLPQISIEDKFYEELNITSSSDFFTFLKRENKFPERKAIFYSTLNSFFDSCYEHIKNYAIFLTFHDKKQAQ